MTGKVLLRGAFGLLVLFLLACSERPPRAEFRHIGLALGTSFSVKVTRLPEGVDPEELRDRLDRLLEEVDERMSTYRPDSELTRFNRSRTTRWQPVSPQLARVVAEALEISRWSGGAFDVTVGPLVNLWGFGPDPRTGKKPSAEAVRAAKVRTGYRNLEVRMRPPALRKRIPELYVDLSAIAKGWAVDRLAEYLERQGIGDYLVEIGGELRLKGRSPRGGPWRIAIEKPVAGVRAVGKILTLTDTAVATSGDYRNYFEVDGRRFSHTIDPRTGYPVSHRLASVTVLRHTCMRADGLATAFMVMGPEQGYARAEAENIPVLFLVKDEGGFRERATSAFRQIIEGGSS